MECQALALYTPLRPEEFSLPVRVFHFPSLPSTWQDITIKQCFVPNAGTGSSVWNASAQLALELTHRLQGRKGKALELGCGLGLVSLVLSVMGWQTLATDGNENLLPCTQENVRENQMTEMMTVEHFIWYFPPRNDPIKSSEILETWGDFDLIVAADVLYGEYDAMDALISTLDSMSTPKTEIYIAQKVRYPQKEAEFRRKLEAKFDLEWIESEELCENLGRQWIYVLRKLG